MERLCNKGRMVSWYFHLFAAFVFVTVLKCVASSFQTELRRQISRTESSPAGSETKLPPTFPETHNCANPIVSGEFVFVRPHCLRHFKKPLWHNLPCNYGSFKDNDQRNS